MAPSNSLNLTTVSMSYKLRNLFKNRMKFTLYFIVRLKRPELELVLKKKFI